MSKHFRDISWRNYLKAMSAIAEITLRNSPRFEEYARQQQEQAVELRLLAQEMRARVAQIEAVQHNPTDGRPPASGIKQFDKRSDKIYHAINAQRLQLSKHLSKEVARLTRAAKILEENAPFLCQGLHTASAEEKATAAHFATRLVRLLELSHPFIDAVEKVRQRTSGMRDGSLERDAACLTLMAALDDLQAVYNRIWFCYRDASDQIQQTLV